jgi:hypothetical protein
MQTASTIIACLAFAGALASWIVGVVFFVRTLREIAADRRMMWLAVFAWPFATSQIQGAGASHAAKVNKALVAFIACVMVGAAAFSASVNLQRFAK